MLLKLMNEGLQIHGSDLREAQLVDVYQVRQGAPWIAISDQVMGCTLAVEPQWTRYIVPYAQLRPHRTDVELEPATIRSVAVVAIGRAFDVDVCVRRFGFFR